MPLPTDRPSYFSAAVRYTLSTERGYVNNPNDKGGPTNFGITLATLSAFRGYACLADDVRTLTRDEAVMIYYKRYWKVLSLHMVSSRAKAVALFDASVLFGVGTSALYCQKALVDCWNADIKIDGYIGARTLQSINAADDVHFLKAFAATLVSRIVGITVSRPANLEFEDGWEARVSSYPKLVSLP